MGFQFYPEILLKCIFSSYQGCATKGQGRGQGHRQENEHHDGRVEKDRKENYKYKRIAVFHLENTGEELDPANLRHLEWQHPFMKNLTSFESYVDLMNISWNSIIPKLRVLADSIGLGSPTNLTSNLSFSQTSNLFGNNNLYTNIDGGNDIPINSTPLPLQELFFKIYDSN